MKRAVLFRFSMILFVALAVSSAISYYFMGNKLLADNETNLLNIVRMIDYSLDGTGPLSGNVSKEVSGNIQEKCTAIKGRLKDTKARITVISVDGTVLADTEAESYEGMENHLERQEIQAALSGKPGYATRYSETTHENMLYVAALSADGSYIVRAATVYKGLEDYFLSIMPMLLLGIAAAYAIATIVSFRFADTITKPLMEISAELQKIHTNTWDFQFKQYRYDELNIISEATMRLAQEVQEHISRLEFEKKVRQEFFSNASHELKTPITAIRGYAELLDNGFVSDEETRGKFIKRILKATENMTQLIEDILMISRLETKEAEVTFSRLHLAPLMDEIFDAVEPIAAEYKVTLHQECEPVVMEASVKQIRELLMNLIVNGIKYNHPGGNVWVKIGASGHNAVIRVKDDGMGIGEEDQARVFERFYRVDKGRSKKMGGTGLGLSIVKHIVEFYDGYMQLKSRLNQGSEFIISLPLQRAEEKG
ncbi:MAG: two-component sensor histidine kinase [Lachnospiraceae bacterium]|nr:two-component sensor histidine kinase [Lachnospiraceae bacterium]